MKIMKALAETLIYGLDTFINGLKNFYIGQVGFISCVFVIPLSPFYSFIPGNVSWGMAYASGINGLYPNIKLMLFGLFQIIISPFSAIIKYILEKHALKKQKEADDKLKKEKKQEAKRRKKKGLPPIDFEGATIQSTEFYSPSKETPNVM